MTIPLFKAGDLASHVDDWRAIGAPQHVIDWILHGVPLNADNAVRHNPRLFSNAIKFGPQSVFVKNELIDLVKCGALCQVPYVPTVVSTLKTVPKKGEQKYRLITDLRYVNQFCEVPKFSNEDIRTVFDIIQPGDYMVTLDLKSAFQHIPVKKEDQTLLGVKFKDKYYVWQVLPFGAKVSPYYCHKVLRPVVSYLRRQGLRLVLYVDDLILCSTSEEISQQTDLLLQTLSNLGLFVNFQKSHLVPSQDVNFIGYQILTSGEDPYIKIPPNRIRRLKKDIRRCLNSSVISARTLARILGQCVAMTRAVLPGKLLLRNAFRLLSTKTNWDADLFLDKHTLKDLNWWLESLDNWNGCPIVKTPIDCQLVTDASSHGWGAHLHGKEAFGIWDTYVRYRPSNTREMFAVLAALKSFKSLIRSKHVEVLSDNISTVAYLNNLGGPSTELSHIAETIWLTCHQNNVKLTVRHLSGKQNVWADRLSRRHSPHDWYLHPAIFKFLDRIWGRHTIDRFASMTNYQVTNFNSLGFDPLASGINALAQTDWADHNNFVNAPFRLLPRILDIVMQQQAIATIIAPWWPAQTWFHRLQELAIAPPLALGHPYDIVVPLTATLPEPMKNPEWKLYAWRVCGDPAYGTKVGPIVPLPNSP